MIARLFAMVCLSCAMVASAQVSLVAVNQHADEESIKQTIQELYADYAIQRWTYTDTVHIDNATKIPHSHPILTLNTNPKYLSNKHLLLSTYLHEQFHWHMVKNREGSYENFVSDIKKLFPNVKAERPYGSGSESGTLSHLVTCYLEFKALTVLLGEDNAREILSSKQYYTWVYQTVLEAKNREHFEKLLSQYKLEIL